MTARMRSTRHSRVVERNGRLQVEMIRSSRERVEYQEAPSHGAVWGRVSESRAFSRVRLGLGLAVRPRILRW